jgi:two-component system, chemotaxis family, sensor kinase CheA
MDLSLANEFIVESKEHLETIEDDLLTLERQQEAPERGLVDKLFRAMHSIKGGAGFIGLKNINNLAHRMETLLALVRSGEIKPTQPIVEVLLKGADQINVMLDDLEHSNDLDIAVMLGNLDQLLESKASPQIQQQRATPAPIQERETKKAYPFTVSQFDLKNRKPENSFLFVLQFDLSHMARSGGQSPVALVRDLLRAGEIIDGHLNQHGGDLRSGLPERLTYDVLFATPIPQEVLGQLLLDNLGVPDLAVVAVEEADFPSMAPAPTAPVKPAPDPVAAKPAVPPPAPVAPVAPPAPAAVASKPKPPVSAVASANGGAKPAAAPVATNPAPATDKAAAAGAAQPEASVRINVEILDELMTLAGELVLVRNQQLMVSEKADPLLRAAVQRLNLVATELQETIMRTRMQPMGNLFSRFPRVVRDLGQKLGKQIEIDATGNEVDVDKTILESLADPLKHLVRNSCDHGLEGPEERLAGGKPAIGRIVLRAYHEGGQINIEIRDDGRGVNIPRVKAKALENGLKTQAELAAMSDKDAIRLIFLPGFSTAEQVTDVSGRGVGMDVVKTAIEKLGGQLDIESVAGQGTVIHLRLPLTLAIIPSLLVGVGDHRYAIPQVNLEELVCLYDDEVVSKIEIARDQEVYRLRDQLLPLVLLSELFAHREPFTPRTKAEITAAHSMKRAEMAKSGANLTFAVVKIGLRRFGLIVDRVIGTEEIVVKPMHPSLKGLRCCGGATVMGDGQVALILDIEGIAKHAGLSAEGMQRAAESAKRPDAELQADAHHMLLFRYGEREQFALALPLIKRIEPIKAENIETIGEKEFITVDGVPTAILRLDKLIKVGPMTPRKDLFLLLPKHTRKPCGLLVSEVIDIDGTTGDVNTSAHREDGVLGTAIVRGHLTLYPDLYRLIEKADPEEKPNQREGRKLRALLAEDTSFFRQLVKNYLESGGFEVMAAENGEQALEVFNEQDFDIIVSDLEMPVMNGWEFIKRVRAGTRNARIPALALSSLATDESIAHAQRAGFDRYEIKMDRGRFLETMTLMVDPIARRTATAAGARS